MDFFIICPIPGDSSSISDRVIFFIAEDGKKRLWIGTNQGLNLYDPEKDHFTVFFDNTINCITGFCLDNNGEPWFGTYAGSGLVSVDLQNQIITAYDESKGLLHNDISLSQTVVLPWMIMAGFGCPPKEGFLFSIPGNKSFVSYLEKDGFQPYDANYISCKTRNGDIWIGSYFGLNRIVPSDC
jgi:hypothetical protein